MIYRITKYDPTLRDAAGRYLPWTWTSYSDIGRAENGCALCPAVYLEIERRYTDALMRILQELHVDSLCVAELEPPVRSSAGLQNDFAKKGLSLSAAQADFLRRVTDTDVIGVLDLKYAFSCSCVSAFGADLLIRKGVQLCGSVTIITCMWRARKSRLPWCGKSVQMDCTSRRRPPRAFG